jgi:hypothetical protein
MKIICSCFDCLYVVNSTTTAGISNPFNVVFQNLGFAFCEMDMSLS